jgi:hypothetical protein
VIYHFVAQYFGLGQEKQTPLELPSPPTQIDPHDDFGQILVDCHRTLSVDQQRIVKELLPLVLRIGSCSKPPKDWRPFWRATRFSPSDLPFRSVVRLWYSIASNYALQQPDGSWQFSSPGYTNLSAVRGMCWLYEEVFAQ